MLRVTSNNYLSNKVKILKKKKISKHALKDYHDVLHTQCFQINSQGIMSEFQEESVAEKYLAG